MATKKQTPKLGRRDDSATVDRMAAEVGAVPKKIDGVYEMKDGRLKMIGAKHDAKVGLAIPRVLSEAWAAEAKTKGITKTDLFEDLMLRYLKKSGWKLGK